MDVAVIALAAKLLVFGAERVLVRRKLGEHAWRTRGGRLWLHVVSLHAASGWQATSVARSAGVVVALRHTLAVLSREAMPGRSEASAPVGIEMAEVIRHRWLLLLLDLLLKVRDLEAAEVTHLAEDLVVRWLGWPSRAMGAAGVILRWNSVPTP